MNLHEEARRSKIKEREAKKLRMPDPLKHLAATAISLLLRGSGAGLLSHALPSLCFLESKGRENAKKAVIDALRSAIETALPQALVVTLECAPEAVVAAGGHTGRINTTDTDTTVFWKPCRCHEALCGGAERVLAARPVFALARDQVARARALNIPCVVVAKDVDLLDDSPSFEPPREKGGESLLSALNPQAVLALLISMWLCPSCEAVTSAEDGESEESRDGEDDEDQEEKQAPARSPLFIIATGESPRYLDRKLFAFPSQAKAGVVASPSEELTSGTADFSSLLSLALTIAKPPFRASLSRRVTELLESKAHEEGEGGEGGATSPATSSLLNIEFDLVLQLLPSPQSRSLPESVSLEEVEGFLRGETNLLAANTAKTTTLTTRPLAETGQQKGALDVAHSLPSSYSFFDKAFSHVNTVAGGHPLKSEIRNAVILPLLAWSYLRDEAVEGGGEVAAAAQTSGQDHEVRRMAEAMTTMKVKPPSGILLFGREKGGAVDKLLLAKGIAQSSRMRLLVVDAALIPSKYVGDSEASIREIFREARKASPCCLVFNNLEVVGGSRAATSTATATSGPGSGSGSGSGAASIHDRMLATLLTEMDGVGIKASEGFSLSSSSSSSGAASIAVPADVDAPLVLVVGVTERKEAIDAALLRPGRLDRHFLCCGSDGDC